MQPAGRPPSSVTQPPDPEEEPEELVKFRNEWKAEVSQKKAAPSAPAAPAPAPPPAAGPSHDIAAAATVPVPKPTPAVDAPVPRVLGTALEVYRQAIQHEQRSELDDALRLYRQAFRMDPLVDKVYHRQETLAAMRAPPASVRPGEHKKGASGADVDEMTSGMQTLVVKSGTNVGVVTGSLTSLVKHFPPTLVFGPEDEKAGVPLSLLPDELLVVILRKLSPTAIERFAAVSRKARVITLDSTIWRTFVLSTYIPPQVTDIETLERAVKRALGDYRRVYIEQPRVRIDGVYIAACHYVRAGMSENRWVTISHLVTYHRYLRFLPNGQVLSLLTNEEFNPQQIIPHLKPTLRMKGFFIGTWELVDDTISIENLLDTSGKLDAGADSGGLRYVFRMMLKLRSRPLGRWNKLELQEYSSVDIATDEATPFSLRHERPFWFSKVKSYNY